VRRRPAARGPQLPTAVREQLTLAQRNGRRLQRLVDDLLECASIEAGRASAVRVETDVAAATAELAGVHAAAERAGLRLTVDCPPLGRPAHVDPRMWEKIVLDLVGNAVKYTFVGGIDVSLRPADDRFVLRVSDTGVGIPAAELPHLFERFHRVSGAAARSREGTGLGPALVRELVDLHGGGSGCRAWTAAAGRCSKARSARSPPPRARPGRRWSSAPPDPRGGPCSPPPPDSG
jgi:signal transduction histidine kinase